MASPWTSMYPLVYPSVVHPSVFSFPNNNLSKYQWIFTKLGTWIDILKCCFGMNLYSTCTVKSTCLKVFVLTHYRHIEHVDEEV